MKNLLELINFAKGKSSDPNEVAKILSAFGPPPEEFTPIGKLPTQNELPSFSVKQEGIGGELSGQTHGVAAPVFGQEGERTLSIGELLTGDINGA